MCAVRTHQRKSALSLAFLPCTISGPRASCMLNKSCPTAPLGLQLCVTALSHAQENHLASNMLQVSICSLSQPFPHPLPQGSCAKIWSCAPESLTLKACDYARRRVWWSGCQGRGQSLLPGLPPPTPRCGQRAAGLYSSFLFHLFIRTASPPRGTPLHQSLSQLPGTSLGTLEASCSFFSRSLTVTSQEETA